MIREAFAAHLLGAPAFTHGMNQLDPIRVDDPEHGRGGQESPRPVLMGLEETKEPGALGKPRKQRPIIARQPAIEGAVPHTFQGMQQPQGDDLTGPEVGFGVCGDGAQLLIDLREQRGDQLLGGHALLRSSPGGMLSTSVEEAHAHDNKASKYYRVYWFVSDEHHRLV